MVLCNRCQAETSVHWKVRPCVKRDGGPCLVCQEDMELERIIQELQDRRRNLQMRMNASHDPFVLTFPPEVSSHILLLSMGEWDYDPYGPYSDRVLLKKLPTPFLLGTVCRGWRQLARSTPRLWTTLSFTLAKPTKVPLFEAVKDWLQLSGGLPLSIWISNYEGENPVSQEMYGPVIDALNQHSGRWHKLSLRIPPIYFRYFCGSSPPSNLYDLDVINRGYLDIDGLPNFRMNFKPSPTYLTIKNIRLPASDIGWENLAYLSMANMTFNGCIEAIRQAPLLESCTIAKCHFTPRDVSIPRTIVKHIHLRTLDLDWTREELFIDLLDSMECPALEEFSYEPSMSNTMADSLVSLLNRSESRLKELSLYADGVEDLAVEDLKKLLNAIPCLQHLYLNCYTRRVMLVIDELLQELSSSAPTLAGGTPGFLPHLQSLTIFSNRRGATIWGCIPQIYTWPHRELLRVDFNVDEIEIDDNTSAKISQLIAQGVNIRVRVGCEDYFRNWDRGVARTGA